MDGVVKFERLGKTRKQVSIYPKAEARRAVTTLSAQKRAARHVFV